MGEESSGQSRTQVKLKVIYQNNTGAIKFAENRKASSGNIIRFFISTYSK